MRKPLAWLAAAIAVSLLGMGLWWFQPWRFFTTLEVSEPLPTPVTQSGKVLAATNSPTISEVNEPEILLEGELISHEHETSGIARIVLLGDGTRVLRLEDFSTSDGPDLEVWLSNAPVVAGFDGWFLADDGEYLSLGKLKGTKGDQNYSIPADVDLSRFSSMSIWCVRFSVSFGAANLAPVS